MIGKRFPRIPMLVTIVGIIVAVVLLSIFYLENLSLANRIVATSELEHRALLEASYERRFRAQLHAIADTLPDELDSDAMAEAGIALNRALVNHPGLVGTRIFGSDGEALSVGGFPSYGNVEATTWLNGIVLLSYPVIRNDATVGVLSGAFDLAPFHADLAAFATHLHAVQDESRANGFVYIGSAMAVMLLFAGVMVWLILRDQTRRIRQLKGQAEKFSDADFGERLPTTAGDELAALANVFNRMRDRLRNTTISRDYLDNLLSGMNEAIIVTSEDGKIVRINTATAHMLGYAADELQGKSIDIIIDAEKSASLAGDTPSGMPKEAVFASKLGESIPVSYTCSVIQSDRAGSSNRIYAAQNITERRRAEKRIRYLARIDALTKVPNRMQFQHLLQRGIARARRENKALCLFYIDIDHFKEINDTFGHLAGDTTLETVAERLSTTVPKHSIIGRLAGDEFAVIVDCCAQDKSREDTTKLAQKILDRLADPFFVQGKEVFMTASMGIAFYPEDAPNVIDLIRNADAALYSAKKSGGNVSALYHPAMNEASVERLMTKSKLKRAFERDELLVHYQPKYNLETGEVIGAEALVRWELPERGLVLPSDFIPIAEETGIIIEIGEWVLDKVCEDFRFWQRSVSSPGRVSVNLSLKQLRQPNFINRISSILRGREVSPTSLELEITETTLMENPERTIKLLDQLYGLGLHLAIDDFGIGYSSLSALQQFPISTLKIDKSFVRDIVTNPDDATIVDTVIQMGRNLNMDVVAEGVETEAQLMFLQKLGCNYAQGLLFGDPMSSDNFIELLLAQAEGTDSYRALFIEPATGTRASS